MQHRYSSRHLEKGGAKRVIEGARNDLDGGFALGVHIQGLHTGLTASFLSKSGPPRFAKEVKLGSGNFWFQK
jgi:hypothetical protein